ncbi:cytochrome P450 2J5-like [Diadema antillarum]|uniref:cytochrome P450 2J5-like n=1 Tax=Diadema antillarum TaxID=105358 RepID=UPI003A8A64A3
MGWLLSAVASTFTPSWTTSALIVIVVAAALVARRHQKPKGFPPGPPGLPIVGNVFAFGTNDAFAETLMQWGKDYGPVYSVRIGFSNDVVVCGADMIKTLLVKKGLDFADKPHLIEADLYNKGRRGIFVSHCREGWEHQRRFAHTTLRGMGFGKVVLEPVIREEVQDTIKQFKSFAGQPFDPRESLATNSSNIICRLTFGRRFEHNDPEFHQLLTYLRGIMGFRAEGEVMVFPVLRHLYAQKTRWRTRLESNRNMFKYFGAKIDEHRVGLCERTRTGSEEPDVLDFIDAYLVQARADPVNFNDEELKVVLSDLFIAGSDTVSTTISWAILYMAAYPDIQKSVYEEIKQVVGEESVCLSHRGALPYSEATLMELQRLASVVPINPRAAFTDSELGGYHIPRGTRVWINMWSLFRDPVEWPQPHRFDPTRFLNKDGSKVIHRDSFLPFSAGRRVCMGEQLAKMELFLFFMSIMQHFEFVFPDPQSKPSFLGVVGLNRQPEPFLVKAIPRMEQGAYQ